MDAALLEGRSIILGFKAPYFSGVNRIGGLLCSRLVSETAQQLLGPPNGCCVSGLKKPFHGSHKGKAVRQLIRAVGAKLFFLPRYSPDLNPIEQVFAKLKHL